MNMSIEDMYKKYHLKHIINSAESTLLKAFGKALAQKSNPIKCNW